MVSYVVLYSGFVEVAHCSSDFVNLLIIESPYS